MKQVSYMYSNKYSHPEWFIVQTYNPAQGGTREGYDYFTSLE